VNVPDGMIQLVNSLAHYPVTVRLDPPNILEVWFCDSMPAEQVAALVHTIVQSQPRVARARGTAVVLEWVPERASR